MQVVACTCHPTSVKVFNFFSLVALYGDHTGKSGAQSICSGPTKLQFPHHPLTSGPPAPLAPSTAMLSHLLPLCAIPNHPQSLCIILPCLLQFSNQQLFTGTLRKRSNTSISEWSSPCALLVTHQKLLGQSALKVSVLRTLRSQTPKSSGNLAVRYTWPARTPCFPFLHAPRGEDA